MALAGGGPKPAAVAAAAARAVPPHEWMRCRDHRRRRDLHHQKVVRIASPAFPHSGDVDDFLRGGARMLQLMVASLSRSTTGTATCHRLAETWGEQTDVHESADWYNAKLLAVMGSNLNMTAPRLPFAAKRGTTVEDVGVCADFSQVASMPTSGSPSMRAGWRLVDGRQSRLTEGISPRASGAYLSTTPSATPTRRCWSNCMRRTALPGRAAVACESPHALHGDREREWKFLMWTSPMETEDAHGHRRLRWGKEKASGTCCSRRYRP